MAEQITEAPTSTKIYISWPEEPDKPPFQFNQRFFHAREIYQPEFNTQMQIFKGITERGNALGQRLQSSMCVLCCGTYLALNNAACSLYWFLCCPGFCTPCAMSHAGCVGCDIFNISNASKDIREKCREQYTIGESIDSWCVQMNSRYRRKGLTWTMRHEDFQRTMIHVGFDKRTIQATRHWIQVEYRVPTDLSDDELATPTMGAPVPMSVPTLMTVPAPVTVPAIRPPGEPTRRTTTPQLALSSQGESLGGSSLAGGIMLPPPQVEMGVPPPAGGTIAGDTELQSNVNAYSPSPASPGALDETVPAADTGAVPPVAEQDPICEPEGRVSADLPPPSSEIPITDVETATPATLDSTTVPASEEPSPSPPFEETEVEATIAVATPPATLIMTENNDKDESSVMQEVDRSREGVDDTLDSDGSEQEFEVCRVILT